MLRPLKRFCIYYLAKKSGRIILTCESNIANSANIARSSYIYAGVGSSVSIGENVSIGPFSTFNAESGFNIIVEKNTTFHSSVDVSGDILIGENCLISTRVAILSTTHQFSSRLSIRKQDSAYIKQNGGPKSMPIVIGNDCWLGINSVILPGVTLGDGCVVGANSVVTKSFPAYSVVGGVPAKLLKVRG